MVLPVRRWEQWLAGRDLSRFAWISKRKRKLIRDTSPWLANKLWICRITYVSVGESIFLLVNRTILANVNEEALFGKNHVDIVWLDFLSWNRALANDGQLHLASGIRNPVQRLDNIHWWFFRWNWDVGEAGPEFMLEWENCLIGNAGY